MRFVTAVVLLLGGMRCDAQAIRDLAGLRGNALPRTEADGDDYSMPATIGFSIRYGGRTYSNLFVNTNGNVTLDASFTDYNPAQLDLNSTDLAIIAAFFADVDTRAAASEPVRFGTATINSRPAFGVNYINVGYFSRKADLRNSFQIVLLDRSDTGSGNFDIEFNYAGVAWDTGETPEGEAAQTPALMGFANGDTAPRFSYQHPGSKTRGALLDGGSNSLLRNSNVGVAGRYVFAVRGGLLTGSLRVTTSSLPAGRAGASYTASLAAEGGAAPYTWSAVGLPSALSISTGGAITGVPAQANTYNPVFSVRDARGAVAQQQLALQIDPATTQPPGPIAFLSTGMTFPMANAQQQTLRITTSRAATANIGGSVALAFTPSSSAMGDDPNYRFTNGSRTVSFTIPSGQTQAVFNPAVSVQTGTIAGRLTLTVNASEASSGISARFADFSIATAPPAISSVRVVRQAGGFELCIAGFSNTREVIRSDFSVTHASGATAGWMDQLGQDLSTPFRAWFVSNSSQGFGGQFLYVQPFLVRQGDSTSVRSVSVSLQNGAGTSQPFLFDMSNAVTSCN